MIEVRSSDKFEITVDYDRDVNYIAVFNGKKCFRSVTIKNVGTRTFNNLTLSIEGFYFPATTFEIESIGANKSVTLDCSAITLSLDKLILLAESVFTEVSVIISNKTRELENFKIPVNIEPWNYWNGDPENYGEIASFVMPNHEYVVELMAKASRLLKETDPDNSMNGYDAFSFEKFIEQIECVWKAITTEDIKYLTQTYDGIQTGQKIMTVDMIKRYRQGNGLDLSLLFCSCLERLNLSPLLIFVPEHVIVGLWLNPHEVLDSPVSFDNKALSKDCLDKKKTRIIVFDSTLLRFDSSTISEASESAISTINNGRIDYMVDIRAARIAGIKPLPFAFSPIDLTPAEKLEIAGYKVLAAGSQRQEGWERKLLDISLRNPMLNLKNSKNVVKIPDNDLDRVIDKFKTNKITDLIDYQEKEKEEKLKSIYRAARSAIEETGANNLFLALGALEWYDADDDKPHISPLIFVPATIVRKKAMTFEVRMRDEESLVNITLLEMMRQMFGIKFYDFEPLPMDDSGIPSWKKIFNAFEEQIKEINLHQTDERKWKIKNDSFLGIFSFTKFLMWNDIHSHPAVILNHPLIRGLIDNRYNKSSFIEDSEEKVSNEFGYDLILPVEFDSSQLKAVIEAHNNESFVLYGPPGTGKSQTITNMIADAIYNGKRVLFVAEKKAALEVVQNRLAKIGLAPYCLELHSNKTDKKSFFYQLSESKIQNIGKRKAEIEDSAFFKQKYLLKELADTLEAISEVLHKSLEQGISVYDAISKFIEKRYSELNFRFEDISHISQTDLDLICTEIESLDIVCSILGMHPGDSGLVGLYPRHNTIENQNELTEIINHLPEIIVKARKKAKGLINILFRRRQPHEILKATDLWNQLENLATVKDKDLQDIDAISVKANNWKLAIENLPKWYSFSDRVNFINSYRIPDIIDYYLKGKGGKDTSKTFKYGYYKSIIDHNLNTNKHLRGFSGFLHQNKIDQYLTLDKDFSKIKRKHLTRTLDSFLYNRFVTEKEEQQRSVLIRRMMSKGRGVSLRKVITDSKEILQITFPCMLMSPLSVAQYLEMKPDMFDLIIFDEASQMETADSIGVIARGKSVIVVGDPKQLPPTRFFTSNTSTGEEIEESEDADSILEDCITLGMPSHYLTRHYRSRHESLISFSNRNFYDNKLLTFPSVNDAEIKVRTIDPEGIYDMGKSRTNMIEAEAVVKYIINYVEEHDKPHSIGVVAFSKAQSNLIEDLLNARLQKNKHVQQKLDECQEPLFIKNLENVQGDERDIIIFSIGYGPDKHGNVSLNFGPLNQGGGERRLNVAVSRAREEMIVFTSLKPFHIPENGFLSKGVMTLRKFLSYAAHEKQEEEVDKNTSSGKKENITDQIADILRKSGKTVKSNLGRSDFKIDLAIQDEKNPEKYKLGIIIDGRNYHSLPTARDREIVVPGVLKNLGWHLHRVWAIDWLNKPHEVIDEINLHLEKIKDN